MDHPTTAPRRPPTVLRRFSAARAENPAVRGMVALGRWLVEACDVPNHDSRTNGEAAVLRAFGCRARVVLDVGAHTGEWARLAVECCPGAQVYCFEVVSATREELARSVAGERRITVASSGLADVDGRLPVKVYPSAPWVSSLLDYPHSERAEWRREAVRTGDRWLREADIPSVDLLKIDAEGGEGLVIDGFARALADGVVKAVQVEYGRANIVAHWLLRDLYDTFESRGYAVGRVRPGGVRFVPYRFEDEDFRGPNYLAVRNDLPDLRARLAGSR